MMRRPWTVCAGVIRSDQQNQQASRAVDNGFCGNAGFVVVKVPLESKVTVAGKVIAEGDEVVIEATGIRY